MPDYYETIEEPRDLSLIRKKLTKGSYRSAGEVIDDLHLMFNNCRTYNSSDAPVYSVTDCVYHDHVPVVITDFANFSVESN